MTQPLSSRAAGARLFNMPPPTQGVASLMILALFERLAADRADSFEHIHGLVEATKQAFKVRDAQVGDPLTPFDAQAAIFTRYARYQQDLQQALTAPRWLLGRTWGDDSTSLKLEEGFAPELYAQLAAAGHVVEVVPECNSMMGHAGAILRDPDGTIEAASDPRSDGMAAAF